MKTLRAIFGWLKKYWYIPLFILGVILGWVLSGGKSEPVKNTKKELDAIDAGSKAQKTAAEKGKDAAVAEVEKEYAEAYSNLSEAQRREASALRSDPSALARYIVRSSDTAGS